MADLNKSRIGKVTDVPFRGIKKHEENLLRPCLAISILCLLPMKDLERHKFIQFCRSHYQESDFLDQISEFELQYRSEEAIKWYTRPSGFPSKLVNTICRTQNPTLISNIRYFLKHLHEQLTRLYIDSLVWIPNSVIVYRGQRFSWKEFQRLVRSNGKHIFTTAFLSATSVDDVAIVFSGYETCSNKSSEKEISVIFKISMQTKTTHSKPFAYIQGYSHVKDEKEILLSIGMIFLCVNIRQREGNFYEVLLIRGQVEDEFEKEILHKALESYNDGITMTIEDFLISMDIHHTPLEDFQHQSLISVLEDISGNIINAAPIDLPLETVQNFTIDVTHDHLIIWLDGHIGEDGVCDDLKEQLTNAINITTDEPLIRSEIDRLILNNEVHPPTTGQLITVTTIEECLALIDRHYHKKIFLITSGSLGEHLVPRVLANYPYTDKIFIFCHNILRQVEWAMDFVDHLLMFDFPSDLFARVIYEIGMHYMQQGIVASDSDDHILALRFFYIARKLVMRANYIFNPYCRFSLTSIEEYITKTGKQIPIDSI